MRVFRYQPSTNSWKKLGADIVGEAAGDHSGVSVSLVRDGSRVTIGARYNDDTAPDGGHFRLYEYIESCDMWSHGNTGGDQCGWSDSMSNDIIAVTSPMLGMRNWFKLLKVPLRMSVCSFLSLYVLCLCPLSFILPPLFS